MQQLQQHHQSKQEVDHARQKKKFRKLPRHLCFYILIVTFVLIFRNAYMVFQFVFFFSFLIFIVQQPRTEQTSLSHEQTDLFPQTSKRLSSSESKVHSLELNQLTGYVSIHAWNYWNWTKTELWNKQIYWYIKAESRLNKWLTIISWWKWCQPAGLIIGKNSIKYQFTTVSTVIIITKFIKYTTNITR